MHKFYQGIEQHIEGILEHGNDDELFASGYLSGHLSVVLARCEEQAVNTKQGFIDAMDQSLAHAYQAKELTPPDQALVEQMWSRLQQS